jgi:molecular chaperone HscB
MRRPPPGSNAFAMKIDADDFELFGLPRRFAQDRAQIDARWKALQSQVHPDRFSTEGSAAQRVAMQWAVRVNEAYQRLKDPLRRAAYLCALRGAPIDAKTDTAMPTDFLLQQMQWREALHDAESASGIEELANEMAEQRAQRLRRLEQLLDEHDDARAASGEVRALMFIERFAEDVDRRLETLEH